MCGGSKHIAQTIADGNYENTKASLSIYWHFPDPMISTCGEINVKEHFLRFVSKRFHQAMDAGHGNLGEPALI